MGKERFVGAYIYPNATSTENITFYTYTCSNLSTGSTSNYIVCMNLQFRSQRQLVLT